MCKVSNIFDNRDVTGIICKFIQAGDIYNLSKVNKSLKSYSLLFYFVKNKLKDNKIFLPEGFTISGSYLLSILSKFDNGEVPRDIDLYTNLKYGDIVTKLFENHGYTNIKYKQVYFGNCKFIDGVQTFTKNNSPKIDIIFINEKSDAHRMIEENFDLTCVKNWYDGKQLYIKNIVNTTGIGQKGKVAKLENYKNSYWERFYKYLKRGYTIDNNSKPIYDTLNKIISNENVTFSIINLYINMVPGYSMLRKNSRLFIRLDENRMIINI
jgi:hypothetical protein